MLGGGSGLMYENSGSAPANGATLTSATRLLNVSPASFCREKRVDAVAGGRVRTAGCWIAAKASCR
jgi:hypothetical protein